MSSLSKLYVTPDEILRFLRKTLRLQETHYEILCQKIIDQVAKERKIIVSPEEVQSDINQMFAQMHLEQASDILRWMKDELINIDDLEAGINDRLLRQRLAGSLFSEAAEQFFYEHQTEFDQVVLYQTIVPYERVVDDIIYQIREQQLSFYEVAHLYDVDERRRRQCGYEGVFYRSDLDSEIAEAAFAASIHEIVGPLRTERGYHLLLVEELIPAELTAQKRQEIIHRMFQEWLSEELDRRFPPS
jgi:parvulin-like peptidyl-prolyl isomerase